MKLLLAPSKMYSGKKIALSGSKSETNRLLLLQALYSNISLTNPSYSDDSIFMEKALKNQESIIDIHHAGTAMRFLTAYFASKSETEITLTGSERMQERPIHLLVDALRYLGADITYEKSEGYPPLKIKGKRLINHKVSIPSNISSQYLSALLLIAPSLPNGLKLKLLGNLTSSSYLEMTITLLRQIGADVSWENNIITVKYLPDVPMKTIDVESDWSSASYYYSMVALSDTETEITLTTFKKETLQGDASLADWYQYFGVKTIFNADNSITIQKVTHTQRLDICLNLVSCPDIAQTIVVTALGLQTPIKLKGLHTLKIKETDRLAALKTEIEKLGSKVSITDDSLQLDPQPLRKNIEISTYQDHRMAMAFAPLALRTSIIIQEAEVVSKSYPDFWEHLEKVGIEFTKVFS